MTDTLPVSEVFGPTFQGEGPSTGRLAAFVRLGGCNLTCDRCDTPYTWDARRFNLRAELTPMTPLDIVSKLPAAPLVVISGGEPTLYQDQPPMAELLGLLAFSRDVEIETNGTRSPSVELTQWATVTFNVSPKLDGPMSIDPVEKRLVPAALDAYAELAAMNRAIFKFVVRQRRDVDTVTGLVNRYRIPTTAVWCMPEGTESDTVLNVAQRLADTVLDAGYNLTLRQHVLLWPGVERGR